MAAAQLTDKELSSQLKDFGIDIPVTPATRTVLMNKLRGLKGQQDVVEPSESINNESPLNGQSSNETPDDQTSNHPQQKSDPQQESEEDPLVIPTEPPKTYYGVAISTATPEATKASLSPYYEDPKTLVKAIKRCVGVRFKKYNSLEEAQAYSKQIQPQFLGPKYSLEKQLSPLPGVRNKTKEKNEVRGFIEEGNMEKFRETIWNNPRFLIGSGDTPEIYHEGMRRNPLHCAVASGRLDMCREVMNMIQSDRFWEMIYPLDALHIRERDRAHLVDMYINMQDGTDRSSTCETPLHIASKNGHLDIVEFLMSFPNIDTTKKNGDGKTPAEISCERCDDKQLKTAIQDIINNPPIYYVPVIRSEDNSSPASLGSPCLYNKESLNAPHHIIDEGVVTSPLIGQAFAGPLSPVKARELLKEWKSPTCIEERKRASVIKRSDPDRGLERIGRSLSHKEGIGWTEYWDFLGCYCDLSKEEGLTKLESYLSSLSASHHHDSVSFPPPPLSSTTSNRLTASNGDERGASTKKQLFINDEQEENEQIIEHFNEEDINEYSKEDGSAQQTTPIKQDNSEEQIIIDSLEPHPPEPHPSLTSRFEELSLNGQEQISPPEYMYQTPCKGSSHHTFITGSEPTKLDRDVHLALCDVTVDEKLFPFVHQWKTMIERYSEEEMKQWHTPRSVNRQQYRTDRTFSPLIYASSPPPPLSSSPSSLRTLQYRRGMAATPTQLLQSNVASPLQYVN